jgi:hypothetical protein
MIPNEQIRLLTRWYGLTPESAVEIIAELRDRTSLLCLVSPYMVRARAVVANKAPGPPPNDLLDLASQDATCVGLPLVGSDKRTNSSERTMDL